jgi:hypothetical protein
MSCTCKRNPTTRYSNHTPTGEERKHITQHIRHSLSTFFTLSKKLHTHTHAHFFHSSNFSYSPTFQLGSHFSHTSQTCHTSHSPHKHVSLFSLSPHSENQPREPNPKEPSGCQQTTTEVVAERRPWLHAQRFPTSVVTVSGALFYRVWMVRW